MAHDLPLFDVLARRNSIDRAADPALIEQRPRAPYWPDGISLIIPAWNEELRLPATLDKFLPLLESYKIPAEVIVVVDGVTDRTAEVAASYDQRGVRVLSFNRRLGKGGAILEGLRIAKFDLVGFLDADAPVTPMSLACTFSALAHADAAIGSRWHSDSRNSIKQPVSRRGFSRLFNLLTRAVLGLKFQDTQCGAKFFRRQAILEVIPKVTLTNWAFDAALLFHLSRAGFKISEVPVDWNHDPSTKLKLERVAPAMLLSLLGVRLMSLAAVPPSARVMADRLYRQFTKLQYKPSNII